MADLYEPSLVPEEYDANFLQEELFKIAATIQNLEVDYIILVEQNNAPNKIFEGMVIKADGVNWNPGAGQGVYVRIGASWIKMT